jgi:DNA-binding NtrC family response regulator
MNKARILIVNDDKLTQKSLYEMLCRHGYAVDICSSVKQVSAYLLTNPCQIILADTKERDGVELLKVVKKKECPPEIIILTSYNNIETAVNNIKMGCFDYLVRPVEDKRIISTIERALIKRPGLQSTPLVISTSTTKGNLYHGLVGNSHSMNAIYSVIERISNSKTTVFLRGESGTGKRMIARAIHKADRKRKDKMFVEVSCGALPREIIESELFGHTKGAFTGAINDRKGRFELADGGTILLDDIDCLPLDLQVKMLRVLQQKEFERVGDNKTVKVDVRIIASTNQDLEKAVADKRFREDLYYRLNVISIYVPPLRERKEDLPALISHFVDAYSNENHKRIEDISPDVRDILKDYDWPGNIRELENIIERAVILDTDAFIDKEDLPEIILSGSKGIHQDMTEVVIGENNLLKDALREPEKVFILKILREVGWNKKKAAKKLGVNRTTLYNKLRKYDLLSCSEKEQ